MKKEIKNFLKEKKAVKINFYYDNFENNNGYGRNSSQWKTKACPDLFVNFKINNKDYKDLEILSFDDFKNNFEDLI
jgi:hypothetical protein